MQARAALDDATAVRAVRVECACAWCAACHLALRASGLGAFGPGAHGANRTGNPRPRTGSFLGSAATSTTLTWRAPLWTRAEARHQLQQHNGASTSTGSLGHSHWKVWCFHPGGAMFLRVLTSWESWHLDPVHMKAEVTGCESAIRSMLLGWFSRARHFQAEPCTASTGVSPP